VAEQRTILVIGGARSGKSAYAEALAENSGKACIYVATAHAGDAEMAVRIDGHRARRGELWQTVEEPIELDAAISRHAAASTVLVIDCLTLWLSNILLADHDLAENTARLARALAVALGPVICVSNEVGHGIIPDNQLARRFRDCQGRLNQTMAANCDAVIQVVAGLPNQLKPAPMPEITL
jgi:adenosylcobinamide kinase/adenosylcobinamide-phosphate guanylyltransferase